MILAPISGSPLLVSVISPLMVLLPANPVVNRMNNKYILSLEFVFMVELKMVNCDKKLSSNLPFLLMVIKQKNPHCKVCGFFN